MTTRVTDIFEQFTIDGGIDYVVHYDDGGVRIFPDYPTEEQLNG